MKKKKTNIYLSYFRSCDTILSQSQKRRVLIFMLFAALFVLQTIGGGFVTSVYSLVGMLAICVLGSLILTDGGYTPNSNDFCEEDEIKNRIY